MPRAVGPAAAGATMDASTGTGATADAHSAVPLTVLDRALLESTGTASLGQALQQLSWSSNAVNAQFNNGGDGSTRISLRGLGAGRTLVLVNGRRHVHDGIGADASLDLEAIPLALVERVEIVRGPAASHGLDAMAGVVNVVTRQDLDGVEAAVFAGGTPDGLGQTYDASVALGHRFERGRITAAAGYYQQQAILGAERDLGRTDYFYDWATGEVTALGSTSTPQGYIGDYGEAQGNQAWQDLVNQYPGASAFYNDPAAGWRPFSATGNSDTSDGDLYNDAPENYLVTPLARYHMFAAGDYRLGDQVRAFAEASYVNLRSETRLAPLPLVTLDEGVVVSADNVYNPFGRDFVDMRRRVVEARHRRTRQDTDTMRLVVGLDGALPVALGALGPWRWEASYGYGTRDSTQTLQGSLRTDRLAAALGPSFIDASGTARCGTPDSPIGDCVPLDLFGGAGTITPAMLRYLVQTRVNERRYEQHRLAVDAGGDLVRTPSGAGVMLTLGADYRAESAPWVGPVRSSYSVRAAHATMSVVPFIDPAAGRALEIQAAANAFDLTPFGAGTTWHVASVARLGAGLAVRASQGRGMGAPSNAARITKGRGPTDGFPAVSDPCDTSSGRRHPFADVNCRADGLPDGFADDRRQLRVLYDDSHTDFLPADIRSIGVLFAPEFVPALVLSADYFAIVVRDEPSSTLGAKYILQSCYESAPDARSHCDRILRDPATGFINAIVDNPTDGDRRETAGIDVQIGHHSDTSVGRLRYRAGGTWLQKFETVSPDGMTHQGKGVYDLGVYPEYTFDGSVLWDNGMFGAGVHLRYVGSFAECEDNNCEDPGTSPDNEPNSHEVESYLTTDVLGSITLTTGLGHSTITVGVRNLLDRQPPVIYNGLTANSDASTYDYTGRFAYVRLTQQF